MVHVAMIQYLHGGLDSVPRFAEKTLQSNEPGLLRPLDHLLSRGLRGLLETETRQAARPLADGVCRVGVRCKSGMSGVKP